MPLRLSHPHKVSTCIIKGGYPCQVYVNVRIADGNTIYGKITARQVLIKASHHTGLFQVKNISANSY